MGMAHSLTAQIYFDGKALDELKIDNYLVVAPNSRLDDMTINLSENRLFDPKKISTQNGEIVKFKSSSHFLSYMFENGWELVELTNDSDGFIKLYIFKKMKKSNSSLRKQE